MNESTVDEIVRRIVNSEEYSPTGLNLLAMRAYFIQNVLLKEKYSASKLVDIGAVEAAIGYNRSLDKIVHLPFVNSVRTDINGFNLMSDLNVALTYGLQYNSCDMEKTPVSCLLNKNKPFENWKSIQLGMDQFLKISQFAQSPEVTQSQNQRLLAAQQAVQAGLGAGGGVTVK